MTTATTPSPAPYPTSIRVISHSMLFYWWPVWMCGLLLGGLSMVDGYRLALVPEGTKLEAGAEEPKGTTTYRLVVPGNPPDLRSAAEQHREEPFPIRMAANPNYGLIWFTVLLVVIFSTNIPLRGLWSVVVLLGFLLLALVLAAFGVWHPIFESLGHLHIYMTAAGFLFPSTVLLLIWLVTVFIFDQKRFIIFTPGQIVVHREVGDLQQVYDTSNVSVEKRRSDFFRHILLGFMSGDLIVQVADQQGQLLELPNVLFAGRKVQQVANLMKMRPVVGSR